MATGWRESGERGSVSILALFIAVVVIIAIGMAVDLTGQVHAQQHARAVAGQAARVGGQQLEGPVALRGQGVLVDTSRASAAARAYLDSSEVSGSVSIQEGTTVVVSTSETYQTKFLSIVGVNAMTVTGQASSRTLRAVEGVEQ